MKSEIKDLRIPVVWDSLQCMIPIPPATPKFPPVKLRTHVDAIERVERMDSSSQHERSSKWFYESGEDKKPSKQKTFFVMQLIGYETKSSELYFFG